MSTTRFYRRLLINPGAMLLCGLIARQGIEDARQFENGPAKTAVNFRFSEGISVLVSAAMISELLKTYETLYGTGVWNDLTPKQKIAYSLLMLLAVTGFTYSTIQSLLGNTTTTLYGKDIPAVAATFFAELANNGAKMIAKDNREQAQIEPAPTEATRLNP